MKQRLTRDTEVIFYKDGTPEAKTLPARTVIYDIKEPKTGTFSALIPEWGHRAHFLKIDASNFPFEEVEDDA